METLEWLEDHLKLKHKGSFPEYFFEAYLNTRSREMA